MNSQLKESKKSKLSKLCSQRWSIKRDSQDIWDRLNVLEGDSAHLLPCQLLSTMSIKVSKSGNFQTIHWVSIRAQYRISPENKFREAARKEFVFFKNTMPCLYSQEQFGKSATLGYLFCAQCSTIFLVPHHHALKGIQSWVFDKRRYLCSQLPRERSEAHTSRVLQKVPSRRFLISFICHYIEWEKIDFSYSLYGRIFALHAKELRRTILKYKLGRMDWQIRYMQGRRNQ